MEQASGSRRVRARQGSAGGGSERAAQQPHCEADAEAERGSRRAAKHSGLSDFEKALMGRLSLRDLEERGVRLSPEQLELLQRVRNSYW